MLHWNVPVLYNTEWNQTRLIPTVDYKTRIKLSGIAV